MLERAETLVAPYEDELRAGVPAGAEIFDAHVHHGTDIDGFVSPLEELLGFLRHSGVAAPSASASTSPIATPRSARRTTEHSRRPSDPTGC